MKKITFYFLMLFSIAAFSQIEIVENFDTTSNGGVPTGWTDGGLDASTSFACGGSGSTIGAGFTATGQTASMTTPNYSAISNGTELTVSFSVNVFEQFSQFPPAQFFPPAAGWGTIVLEYTTDGTNWNTITTVNDSNFTYVDTATCVATGNISAGIIANGSDFQARFVATAGNITNFALQAFIDNVSITQVANAVPNCDVTLISPAAGSNTAEIEIPLTWQAATGLPTGYTVSVGTGSGLTDVVNAVTTTEPSYNLTGLSYNTDYYVNIVPFNGIGDATGCAEQMFTTRTPPIPGASCSSPIVVSSFPFLISDDTANYEDNFDASPCSNSYLSGKDVFYEITPTTDISIDINVTNILPATGSRASIHVVEGCIDTATECLAYVGAFSAPSGGVANERTLEEVLLLAGNTYYIVLSTSSNTATFSYSMFIEQNSCIDPAMTLTPVADCGNGQFNVDVDVSYLGDASSLTLSDDFDSNNTMSNITATGVVSMGPYPSGTTVNFNLSHNQDGACSYGDSTFYYCPPSNDDCSNSINLTVNTDGTCTNVYSGTNAGATKEDGDDSSCFSDNNNDVWYNFVATAETMVVEYFNITAAVGSGGTLQATELLDGACGAFTSLGCLTGDYLTFSGLTINNTYYIRNYTNLSGEYAQNYDICVRELPAAPANDDCSNAVTLTVSTDDLCDNQVAGSTIGATTSADNTCTTTTSYGDVWYVFNPAATGLFEFSLERLSTSPSTYYSIFSGSCGALTEMSTSCTTNSNQIVSLDMSITYYVQVRSVQTDPGIDFNLCVWQLPDPVVNSDCGGALTLTESADINGNNMIAGDFNDAYYSAEGCSSSSYESVWYSFTPTYTGLYHVDFTRVTGSGYYTIYNTDTCANTGTAGFVSGITSCYNSGAKDITVVSGSTYLIYVHSSSAAEFELFAYPDASLSIESNEFEAFHYFPNPVKNSLTVEARNTISNISVYNMIGQEVKSTIPNALSSTISMSELNNGIYFVTITINDTQKTIKIIKK